MAVLNKGSAKLPKYGVVLQLKMYFVPLFLQIFNSYGIDPIILKRGTIKYLEIIDTLNSPWKVQHPAFRVLNFSNKYLSYNILETKLTVSTKIFFLDLSNIYSFKITSVAIVGLQFRPIEYLGSVKG